MDIAVEALSPLAEESGYSIRRDLSSLDIDFENLAVPYSVLGTMIGVYTALFAVPYAFSVGIKRDKYHLYKVHFVDHYRARFKYALANDDGQIVKGSCVYFFSVDEKEEVLDYEFDRCSHSTIFPQTEMGLMRTGSNIDFIEKYITDQDEVVATGSVLL